MKYLVTFCIVFLCLSIYAQTNRTAEIEQLTETIFTAKEFMIIADSLQLSVSELSDYPVIFPIKKPVTSSGFGMRRHPVYNARKFHTGIDIPKAKGTPVYASGNGVVIGKGYNSGYGRFIEIEHRGGFRSFYAHLYRVTVNIGDTVAIAQPIGFVGNTGVTTGSHLHYEVRKGDYYLNPREWGSCLGEILRY